MKILLNGKPFFEAADEFIDQAMNATPVTHYVHDWVTGVVDEGVTPVVKVGECVGWAVGKGLWNVADYAGYLVYEKLPSGAAWLVHEVVTETIKNCTAGTGCI